MQEICISWLRNRAIGAEARLVNTNNVVSYQLFRCPFQYRRARILAQTKWVILETCRAHPTPLEVQQLRGRRFGEGGVCGITLFSQSRAMASNLFEGNFANLHLYRAKFFLKSWFVKDFVMRFSNARYEAAENLFPSLSSVGFGSSLYQPTCYSLSWFGFSLTNCRIQPWSGLLKCPEITSHLMELFRGHPDVKTAVLVTIVLAPLIQWVNL